MSAPVDINQVFRSGGRSIEFLDQINKASIVMLAETGIVPRPMGARIASAIAQVIEHDRQAPPRNTADYLDYEPRLLAVSGPEGSRLHTGRSRQDLASTLARMNLRDGALREIEALVVGRDKLLALAARHTQTIIPCYTHGVQAQPTTFAHYLLALTSMLGRQTERLRQAHDRVNLSPLGTAALATSSFPLDRAHLSELLGFDGLLENAYDANHFAPIDCALDVAAALSIIAVQLGQFAQDIHAQYAEPVPWFMLASGELTGVSSIMPQKRNPAALEQLRAQSSIMIGEMQTVTLIAHNTRSGMFDYRMYDPVPSGRPLQVMKLFHRIVDGIVVDKARALAEVHADYSTTTEIADALLQRADVPFRIGHHFASRLTDHGRSLGLKLHQIAYADAARLYAGETGDAFPLDPAGFSEVISAEYMVFGRRGTGGPQLEEVDRMLGGERERMAADHEWASRKSFERDRALAQLDQAFAALAAEAAV
jgi:argininosuccinate lyase